MGRARDIRLLEDAQKVRELELRSDYLSVTYKRGTPPTEYLLRFNLTGYLNREGKTTDKHIVRITFPEQYPFSAPPKFSFLRGLYHPNVYRNGDVCHGWYLNNWHPAIRVDDLLMDLAKMICFKKDSYNLKSPANYDCDEDWIAANQIPIDDKDLQQWYPDISPSNQPKIIQEPTIRKSPLQINVKSTKNFSPSKIKKSATNIRIRIKPK